MQYSHEKGFFTRLWGIKFLSAETSETIPNFFRDSLFKSGGNEENCTAFGRIKVQVLVNVCVKVKTRFI